LDQVLNLADSVHIYQEPFRSSDPDEYNMPLDVALRNLERYSASTQFEDSFFLVFLNYAEKLRKALKTQSLSRYFEDFDEFVVKTDHKNLGDLEMSIRFISNIVEESYQGKEGHLIFLHNDSKEIGNMERIHSSLNQAFLQQHEIDEI
jgi:hypothetical protein